METKLDLKDKKILYELDKNSRIPLSKIAKKVRLSKEVVFHRINKLVSQGFIIRFQTLISSYALGYESYKIYLKYQNMTKEIREELQLFLLKHKKVYWIGNCQGRWDLIIGCWGKDVQNIGKFEDEFLNKYSNYIQEKEVSISRKSMQYNRSWFYGEQKEVTQGSFGEEIKKLELDNIDLEILKWLANNARIKITKLAKKINTTTSIIRYRLKQLEKNKAILGYKFALNPKLLGYETCKSFINFKNISNEKRQALIEYCKQHPNIINYVLTFGSWDMELELEVKNFNQYYEIMNLIQEEFKEIIKSYDSIIISSEPKQVFIAEAYEKIE